MPPPRKGKEVAAAAAREGEPSQAAVSRAPAPTVDVPAGTPATTGAILGTVDSDKSEATPPRPQAVTDERWTALQLRLREGAARQEKLERQVLDLRAGRMGHQLA